tara:strand:- start:475 stop:1362 length:888 start_codon:yes stop_codon:yes gene_type:complete
MTKNTTKIGIIGTGIIGLPVANNLLKKKYNVYAYVRNKKKHSEISKKGIIIKRSLAEFFRSIDILILAVSDTNDVKNILIGKNGLNKSLKTPSIVIDMSTICPIETIKISNELSKNNISLIDAPVSGGEIGAIKGNLSIMIGGEKNIVKKIMPIFKILGDKITHVGKTGSGQVAKACNQLIVAQTINAVSEAFILADKFKTNKQNIREALLGGFAYSKILEIHGKRILENNYSPGFKTKLHSKDLKIVKNIANKKNLKLEGSNLVNKYMNKCNNQGNGEKDSSAYYKIIKNINNK